MSTLSVGKPIDRVDGRLKVTGGAKYSAEFEFANLAHAVIVNSTASKGRLLAVDSDSAEKVPGVLAVMTHLNTPKMRQTEAFGGGGGAAAGSSRAAILNTDRIYWRGQPIAVVVGETLEAARHAAALLRFTYESEHANLTLESNGKVTTPKHLVGEKTNVDVGDAEKAMKSAKYFVDETYRTPPHNHNPIEPHATIAAWNDGTLVVHDATQFVFGVRNELASRFGLKQADVRVISPFVGGGFGGKGVSWPHTYLAVAAAKFVGRPVKLVLTRQQMYASTGGRPPTRQRVALGADGDGKLTALIHTGRSAQSTVNTFAEQFTFPARHLYACPNIHLAQEVIDLDVCPPTFMRAPGETPGTFALESAMDELAYALKIDPIELRVRNEPRIDPTKGTPFSNRKYLTALRIGMEKFGWSRRKPAPMSMRDGRFLVGMGVASAFYPVYHMPSSARVEVAADGSAVVQAGCHEMGMGTATAQTQIAADLLGLPLEKVRFELGDTALPFAAVAGGSSQTISIAAAVSAACDELKKILATLAVSVDASPLKGAKAADLAFRDGGLYRTDDSKSGESFQKILERAGKSSAEGRATGKPTSADAKYSRQSYGAQFCEVRVDPDFGTVRVVKFVGAFDVGRVVNAKTARSQFLGGITMGVGMALLEQTHRDEKTGKIVNDDISEYMVPVNADVPSIDVVWVGEPDPHTPMGAHGIGEIGITGVAAAVANAVFHATGKRIRDLPITPEKLMRS